MGRSIEREVLVVSIDSDNMGGGQKNMPPGMKPMDDHEEFSVINVVILLRLIEGTGYAPNRSESSLGIFL